MDSKFSFVVAAPGVMSSPIRSGGTLSMRGISSISTPLVLGIDSHQLWVGFG